MERNQSPYSFDNESHSTNDQYANPHKTYPAEDSLKFEAYECLLCRPADEDGTAGARRSVPPPPLLHADPRLLVSLLPLRVLFSPAYPDCDCAPITSWTAAITSTGTGGGPGAEDEATEGAPTTE